MKEKTHGFTLLEMMLVAATIGLLALAFVKLLQPALRYFQGNQVRQQANLEARRCMETIQRVMSNGKISTVDITTPPTNPLVYWSHIEFQGVDGSSFTITWSTAPMNTVHLQRTPPGGTMTDSILATHVLGLHFTLDVQNPGVISVSLRMVVPLNSSGLPDSFYTIFLPAQTVLMSAF